MEVQSLIQRSVKRIRVVLGEDPRSWPTELRYAAGFAALFDASVSLVYRIKAPVIYPGPELPASGLVLPTGAYDRLSDEAESMLDEAKALMAGFGVEAEAKLVDASREARHGSPEGDCDLIVMSKPKPKGLGKLFADGETIDIVSRAGCPVIVIYPPNEKS